MATKSKELTVDPGLMDEFQREAGAGLENTGAEDYAIPFISIIQSKSPQCDADHEGYIEGAKPGMFWDNGAMQILKDEDGEPRLKLPVTPIHYTRRYNQWRDRKSGGGFVGSYDVNAEIIRTAVRDERGRLQLQDDTYLMDTRQFLCMVYDKDLTSARPCIIGMASTQIRAGRQWITRIAEFKVPGPKGKFNPPMYGQIWELSTVTQSNSQGTWRGWKIGEPQLVSDPAIYKAAKQLREDCAKGALQIGAPSQGGGEAPTDESPPFDGDEDGAAF